MMHDVVMGIVSICAAIAMLVAIFVVLKVLRDSKWEKLVRNVVRSYSSKRELRQHIEDLRMECDGYSAIVRNMREDLQEKEDEVESLQSDVDRLQYEVNSNEDEISVLQDEIDDLNRELDDVRNSME